MPTLSQGDLFESIGTRGVGTQVGCGKTQATRTCQGAGVRICFGRKKWSQENSRENVIGHPQSLVKSVGKSSSSSSSSSSSTTTTTSYIINIVHEILGALETRRMLRIYWFFIVGMVC